MAEELNKIVIDGSQVKQLLNELINQANVLNKTLSKDTSAAFSKVASEGQISFTKLAGAIGLATGAYEILAKAVEKTIEVIKGSFNLYSKEESFVQRVGFALNNNALLTERMIKLRDELNKNPLFTKEQINSGIEFAVAMGRSESQTKKLIEAAEGYSRISGKDMQTALTELNGTLNGTIGRLGKYVEGVKGMSTAQAKNGDVLEKAWKQLAKYGDKAGEIETAQAKLAKQFANTEEELGKKLAPVLTKALELLSQFVTYWVNVYEAVGRLGTRLYEFSEKYLKPVVFVVENAVKVVKFLTTGLADFVLWLDKVTGNQDLYKAGDNMVKYAKKVQDDYVNSDAAGKKKILEQQQKYADEAAKKSDASSKRAYDTHMKLINDLQQLDLKGTPEETDAEKKKAEEAAKKKQEELDKIGKKKFETLKKQRDEKEKLDKENLKLDEQNQKAELDLLLSTNDEKIKDAKNASSINLKDLKDLYSERITIINDGVKKETESYENEKNILQKSIDPLKQTPEQISNIVKQQEVLQLKILATQQKGVNDAKAIIQTQKKDEETLLKQRFDNDLKLFDDYQNKVNRFAKENADKHIIGFTPEQLSSLDEAKKKTDDVTKSLLNELEAAKAAGVINLQIFSDLSAKLKQAGQDVQDTNKEVVKSTKQLGKEVEKAIEQTLVEATSKVVNAAFENAAAKQEQQLQKTLDNLDKMATKETSNLDKLLKNKYISEAEYARRKDKIDKEKEQKETAAKKDKAKKDKKLAEEQALINAFLAASMALASGSPPESIIMAAIALALGLVDFGIIAAKPLEYKTGTSKVPSMFASGGFTKNIPIPNFAVGGFTSPNGDQNGIPAILHPNEAVLNSTAMSAPGMPQVVTNANQGQAIQTQTQLHPDSINAIVNGINNKKVVVSQYDIQKQTNKVNVLQGRATL